MLKSSPVKQKVNILIDLKEIKNKIVTKNNLYCLGVISIIFFLDRYTKLFIINNFTENTYYLNNYIKKTDLERVARASTREYCPVSPDYNPSDYVKKSEIDLAIKIIEKVCSQIK